jgi:hypothetical protein
MTITEKIIQHIQNLPESLQAEVLDFVEYLEAKVEKGETDWAKFSLSSAMRGMEDETAPYSVRDLKEIYS